MRCSNAGASVRVATATQPHSRAARAFLAAASRGSAGRLLAPAAYPQQSDRRLVGDVADLVLDVDQHAVAARAQLAPAEAPVEPERVGPFGDRSVQALADPLVAALDDERGLAGLG